MSLGAGFRSVSLCALSRFASAPRIHVYRSRCPMTPEPSVSICSKSPCTSAFSRRTAIIPIRSSARPSCASLNVPFAPQVIAQKRSEMRAGGSCAASSAPSCSRSASELLVVSCHARVSSTTAACSASYERPRINRLASREAPRSLRALRSSEPSTVPDPDGSSSAKRSCEIAPNPRSSAACWNSAASSVPSVPFWSYLRKIASSPTPVWLCT